MDRPAALDGRGAVVGTELGGPALRRSLALGAYTLARALS